MSGGTGLGAMYDAGAAIAVHSTGLHHRVIGAAHCVLEDCGGANNNKKDQLGNNDQLPRLFGMLYYILGITHRPCSLRMPPLTSWEALLNVLAHTQLKRQCKKF